MQRADWLLVYLDLPTGKKNNYVDPIRIMKGLFLMRMKSEKEGQLQDLGEFYDFIPYLYGPCSFDVYGDLTKLISDGLVEKTKETPTRWDYYRLTVKGKETVAEITKSISNDLLERLKSIKTHVMGLEMIDLLREVYKDYPTFATKSIITV